MLVVGTQGSQYHVEEEAIIWIHSLLILVLGFILVSDSCIYLDMSDTEYTYMFYMHMILDVPVQLHP